MKTAWRQDKLWDVSLLSLGFRESWQCQANDQLVEGVDQSTEVVIRQLKEENEYLKERIQELEQARERSDTIILQMTRQLENQQKY